MYEQLEEWLRIFLQGTAYTYQHGEFSDATDDAGNFFCALIQTGGPTPDVEDRTKRFSIYFIGRAQNRGDAQKVLADAESIVQATMGEIMPCGAARVGTMTEPIGPGFSNENRAFCQLDIEINF